VKVFVAVGGRLRRAALVCKAHFVALVGEHGYRSG
jgi:hypothetical protein